MIFNQSNRFCSNCTKGMTDAYLTQCINAYHPERPACNRWHNPELKQEIHHQCPQCEYIEYNQNTNEVFSYNPRFKNFDVLIVLDFRETVYACPLCGVIHYKEQW